jgi:transcriptional regulator with XRE-family HTH domain
MSKIGDNIKNARKAKGLTQKELAKLLNCSHTTVSKYEQGEIENMPRPRMNLLADILDISPIVLFDLADKTKQPVENELSDIKRALIELVEGLSESEAAVLLASLKSGLGR